MPDETILEGDLNDERFRLRLIKELLGHADPNNERQKEDLESELFDVHIDLLIALREIASYPNQENDCGNARAMRAIANRMFGDGFEKKPARVRLRSEPE